MFVISKCLEIGKSRKLHISRCLCISQPINSHEEQMRLRSVKLAELLDCSLKTATVIIGKNTKVLSLDDSNLEKTLEFCKNNFRFSDIVEYPAILSIHHRVLNRRFHALKEFGCQDSVHSVVKFSKVMKRELKLLTPKTFPYSQKFLQNIFTDCPPKTTDEIRTKLFQMYNTECSFHNIKMELNSQYFLHQLKFSEDKIRKMKVKIPALFMRNLQDISTSLKMLIEKYELTFAKIHQCPFLLTLDSDHLTKYLECAPSMLDIPLRTLIKKNPEILRKSSASVKKLEQVLQDFNITERQLMSCPKILIIKPATARHRLQALHNSKDFMLFKPFRNFLWLVVNYKHCHSRLKIIKESGLAYSLGVFLLSKPLFKKRIFLNKSQTYIKEINTYLADVYNINEKSMRKHIAQLPNIYSTSFVDVHKVVNFLFHRGISKEQLWNGLGIIVYEPEIVEKFFDELPHSPEFQPFSEWSGHFNLIQLLIYAIERSKNNVTSSNKNVILSTPENISNYNVEEDESEELFREYGVDYFSDSDIDDAEDSDSEEEEKISDVHKL